MNTDWSKAPDWAKEIALNPYDEKAWLGDDGYSYLMGNGGVLLWSFRTAYPRTAFKIMQIRPRQLVWTGEGLPPVGTVCEYRAEGWPGDQWEVRTLMYASEYHVITKEADGVERRADGAKAVFRPIRTPEQIAAEERDLGVEAIRQTVSKSPNCKAHGLEWDIACAIYDAGWRKQPAP